MTVGFAFVIGIVVGRIMGDIAEWLHKRQAAKDDLRFAKGYLAGIDAGSSNSGGAVG
jgi:hypothetical protein